MSAARVARAEMHTEDEVDAEPGPAVDRGLPMGALKPLSAYAWDVMTPSETWREVVLPRLERADADRRAAEETYACLRSRAHELVSGRRHKGDIAGWHDLIRRACVLLRDASHEDLAFRTDTLSELVYMTYVNAERHDVDAVMRRKHVRDILALIVAEGGDHGLPRATVLRSLGILDANLSRILLVMEGAGLIVRTSHGKETRLALTPEGRRRAAGLPAAIEPVFPAARERAEAALQNPQKLVARTRTVPPISLSPTVQKARTFRPRIDLEQQATDREFATAAAESRTPTPTAAGGY